MALTKCWFPVNRSEPLPPPPRGRPLTPCPANTRLCQKLADLKLASEDTSLTSACWTYDQLVSLCLIMLIFRAASECFNGCFRVCFISVTAQHHVLSISFWFQLQKSRDTMSQHSVWGRQSFHQHRQCLLNLMVDDKLIIPSSASNKRAICFRNVIVIQVKFNMQVTESFLRSSHLCVHRFTRLHQIQ